MKRFTEERNLALNLDCIILVDSPEPDRRQLHCGSPGLAGGRHIQPSFISSIIGLSASQKQFGDLSGLKDVSARGGLHYRPKLLLHKDS
jgi:hypothetical protein